MGPSRQSFFICPSHGPHVLAMCPGCVDNLVNMFTSTVQQSFCNESEPISLGRWEQLTESDREFLSDMRISVK